MSAAETLDISDLVFVNWAKDEYELSSISDDDYTISPGNGLSQTDELDLDASYINLSSYSGKGMIEDREYDLSILLNLFNDYPDLQGNASYFPHLFLDFNIPRTSIMILAALTVGIFTFILSSITISRADVNSPIQSQQALMYAAPLIDLRGSHICPIAAVEKTPAQKADEDMKQNATVEKTSAQKADEDIKQNQEEITSNKESKQNMDAQKPMSLRILFRLLKLVKNLMIKAQVYIKRRLYQLRRDIRVSLGKN